GLDNIITGQWSSPYGQVGSSGVRQVTGSSRACPLGLPVGFPLLQRPRLKDLGLFILCHSDFQLCTMSTFFIPLRTRGCIKAAHRISPSVSCGTTVAATGPLPTGGHLFLSMLRLLPTDPLPFRGSHSSRRWKAVASSRFFCMAKGYLTLTAGWLW